MLVFMLTACSKDDDEPEVKTKTSTTTTTPQQSTSSSSTTTTTTEQYGTLVIKHSSSSTYDFYLDGTKKDHWTSKGTYSYEVKANVKHTIEVEQKDGYLFNPTKGTKEFTVKPGEKVTFSGPKSNTSVEYFN